MASNNKGAIEFIVESIKNISTVGTVTRSSKFLCQNMIKPVDFEIADVIVELGAGDGVVTHHILEAMKPDAKLLTFEVNDKFCEVLNQIEDDRLIVVSDSAEKLDYYLKKHNLGKADYILSALPFTILPEDLTKRIITTCKEQLKKNGLYIQMHYSLIPAKIYRGIFGNLKKHFVPLNIPPAWVFVCQNK